MNKVKMFFIAAALVLTTAGVFAGKARFTNASNLWVRTGASTYQQITSSSVTGLVTTGTGSSAQILDRSGNPYDLYYSPSAGSYSVVYTDPAIIP